MKRILMAADLVPSRPVAGVSLATRFENFFWLIDPTDIRQTLVF